MAHLIQVIKGDIDAKPSSVPLDVEGIVRQIPHASRAELLELFHYLNAQTNAHLETLKVTVRRLLNYP